MTPAGPRPRSVTQACLLAGVGSLIAAVGGVAAMAKLGSVEQREQLQGLLSQPPYDRTGVSLGQALDLVQISLIVLCAAAAASVVLAVWTWRGHRGTRVLLTVMAAVSGIVFLMLSLAGIVSALLAFVTVHHLWTPQARGWFADRPFVNGFAPSGDRVTAPRSGTDPHLPGNEAGHSTDPHLPGNEAGHSITERAAPEPAPEPAPGGVDRPPGPRPGEHPYGAPPVAAATWHGAPERARAAARTPRSVVAAVVVTSVLAGMVLAVCGTTALVYLLDAQYYVQLLQEQSVVADSEALTQVGGDYAELARLVFLVASIGAALATAAVAAALLMLLGSNAARIVLVVLSVLTALLSLAFVIAMPVGLLWVAGSVGVVYACFRPDARSWFRRRR